MPCSTNCVRQETLLLGYLNWTVRLWILVLCISSLIANSKLSVGNCYGLEVNDFEYCDAIRVLNLHQMVIVLCIIIYSVIIITTIAGTTYTGWYDDLGRGKTLDVSSTEPAVIENLLECIYLARFILREIISKDNIYLFSSTYLLK